jgi:hypothetical protein
MKISKELEREFKEFERRIERLKQAEKRLTALGAPVEVFGAEITSIKSKLKLPKQVEAVEREVQELEQKVAEYRRAQKEAVERETVWGPRARQAVEAAKTAIEEAKWVGARVEEAEGLLRQSLAALERKDYQVAAETAEQATQSAQEARRLRETTLTAEEAARETIEAAQAMLAAARDFGCNVAEVEGLLNQAAAALERKDYPLAMSRAEESIHLSRSLKEQSKPAIAMELAEKTFQPNVWKAVDLNVENQGNAHAQDITINFSKEVETKWLKGITKLNAGARETLKIGFKPTEEGEIPLDAEIVYRDLAGKEYREAKTFWLNVRARAEVAVEEERPVGVETLLELPQYRLLEKVGSGGFSDIYRAERSDGLIVALKVPRLAPFQTFVPSDFLKEAEIWSKLNHPHIVKVFEYSAKPYPWIAIEFMEGGSLRSRIGKLSLEDSLDIALKLSQALFYAHHYGVIHRDIKPENVLFDQLDTPKLTDWGLGKVMLEASRSVSGFKGTLAYSAPEQLSVTKYGEPDWRTDIYQLGAMLFEMLTGQLPFGGELARILTEELVPPSKLVPGIPPEVDELVLRSIARKKEDRFSDVSLLSDYLQKALKQLRGG